MDRITEILQHKISYWYKPDQEIPEHEIEHIETLITAGFTMGELNDNQARGWWRINWN